jgi:hypothetical protein
VIAEIEAECAELIGHERFDATAQALNALLSALTTRTREARSRAT